MLSRDADACFWVGRYVERAEATARMADVHFHSALENHKALPDGQHNWQPLLEISGTADQFAEKYQAWNDRDALYFFAFDEEHRNSILCCWYQARENARAIREHLASEMWESLNVSYLQMREWDVDKVMALPHVFFRQVKDASHLFQGILNRTMLMGETRDWLDAGRFLERAQQTARLLDVRFHDLVVPPPSQVQQMGTGTAMHQVSESSVPVGYDVHAWIAVLKSVSAFEMYRKTHQDGIKPEHVVDFLVLNPNFPASVRHGISRTEGCLRRISGRPGEQFDNEADRLLGRLKSDLSFIRAEEILAGGLHDFLQRVQDQCLRIGAAINGQYLSY